MEAVRPKQSKKPRAKAKPLDAVAVGDGAATGYTAPTDDVDRHALDGAVWELPDDEREGADEDARTTTVDDEIAQNEDDIMALLGDGEPKAASVVDVRMEPKANTSATSLLATADQQATTQRIPTLPPGVQAAVGSMTATAVPSAPNFDDSDEEDAPLPRTAGVGDVANSSTPPDVGSSAEPIPLSVAPGIEPPPFVPAPLPLVPTRHLRPSAPDPSDSPQLPPTAVSMVANSIPSAPLEDEEIDLLTRSQAPRLVTIPSAPIVDEDAKHTTVAETNTVELKHEEPSQASALQGQRLRISMAKDRVEKTGEGVRSSLGKLLASDSANRLYPTVVTNEVSVNGRIEGLREQNLPTMHSSSTERHPVFIKLEPHTNFEMNLLRAAASQKRQEAKMHNIEINKGDLYGRLERYLYAEYLLHTASASLETRKQEVDALIQKVWLLETKRLSSSMKCGDQVDLEEVLEFQTARFDVIQHAKLKNHLESVRQLRTVEASMHTFDRALSYFHIEQYINHVLQEPTFLSYLNKMSAASMATKSKMNNLGEFETVPETISFYETLPAGSSLASSVDHLKYCIDVMIFFEKKVTVDDQGLFGRVPPSFARGELVWESTSTNRSVNGGSERKIKCYACSTLNEPMEPNHWCKFCKSCGVLLFLPPSSVSNKSNDWYTSVLRFRQSLQKWISLCLRTLLRLRSLVNMPYLLMHVMYLPRISTEERSWILRFLQFPKAVVTSSGDLRETWSEDLVDHYVAMLHLVFHPEKLRKLTTLVSSELPSRHKGTKKGGASFEWVLLENPEMLDRCYLSDEDFVAVINQFPHTFAFEQLFSCTMDTKKCFSRALALVIEFTQGLRLFQEFEKFPARVAQLLGELLLNASMVSAGSSTGTRQGEHFFYPTLFDQLFLTALHGLLVADCNRVAWRSIRNFPFAPLSPLAKWDVLGLLLFGISSVPSEAKSANGWVRFIDKACVGKSDRPKPARRVLCDQVTCDTDNAMNLMHAVARLAASATCGEEDQLGRDLVLVTTQELFLAGFANSDCRKSLGESGERAAGPISTICLAHPWVISELISLLFKYHECAETWIHVFETFPVNRWLPTPDDLGHLQDWLLLDDAAAPRSTLARFLLDRINWEFDMKAGQLFTNAFLHRQVALVVTEALLVYRSRKLRGRRDPPARQANGEATTSPPKLKSLTKSIRRVFRFERSVDFEQWCWKLMLKLKFYSPRSNQPFVQLVDLRNDRSREALLLRRWFPGGAGAALTGPTGIKYYDSYDQQLRPYAVGDSGRFETSSEQDGFLHKAALAGVGSSGAPIHDESATDVIQRGSSSSDLNDSTEFVTSVTVTSTCDVEPIVAYLVCQTTTFVFSERMDRWEPLLVLLKNGLFTAGVRVLENVLPFMAKLDRAAMGSCSGVTPENLGRGGLNHALSACMAAMENMSTDQLLQLVEALELHSFVSAEERQLLTDLLQKGYIGGWESTAKTKVLSKLRFVRECSTYIHPLVLPSLINEAFPQSNASAAIMSTTAMFQGAMSWLTSALRGGHSDPPSPSTANSIVSAMTIRKSHLIASVPTAVSAPGVTAAAAAASLGIVDAPDDYTATTQKLCAAVERAFEVSTSSTLKDVASFWMRMVLQVPYWFEHPALRHIVDVLLRCSMREYYRTVNSKKAATISGSRGAIHLELVSILSSEFEKYCAGIKVFAENEPNSVVSHDEELPPVVSFLPSVTSIAGLSSIFGGNSEPAQFIGGCSTFAFWTLLVEVRQELPLFLSMGELLIKYEPAAMKKVEKFLKSEGKLAVELCDVGLKSAVSRLNSLLFGHVSFESLSHFKIYRWAEYCLELPDVDDNQILFWQVFFALYFACAGGTRVFGQYFLNREDSSNPKHTELKKSLQAKLRSLTTFCSNQAQLVLTESGGSATGKLTTEGKELRYQHFVQLSHIYTAMDAWLEERDPNKWLNNDELGTLPRHFEVSRLKDVLKLSDSLLNTPTTGPFQWPSLPLWMDLCGFEFDAKVLSVINEQEDDETSVHDTLSTTDHLQEEDFAFIEDRDMRRFSSLGSSGEHGRTASPLQLTPEYAGPRALTVTPQVAIQTTPDRCIVTPSVPLNRHALKTLSTKFSETLSILVGLDVEVLDHVSKLFVSKPRIVSESKACIEGTNCRKPVAFRFEFIEWTIDKQLMDTIQTTLAQAERYDLRSMVEQGSVSSSLAALLLNSERQRSEIGLLPDGVDEFLRLDADGLMLSMQILLIDQVVQALEAECHKMKRELVEAEATVDREDSSSTSTSDQDPQPADSTEERIEPVMSGRDKTIKDVECRIERLHEKGLDWFRQLTELDTKLSRMVPPLREVLWRSIKQLGIAFVCVDERETCNLLQLMLDDPSRITLLSECFSPASAPARFVEMFSNLMSASASSKLSREEKYVLLQRFEFQAWLNTKAPHSPTKFDRDTVLSIILGDVGVNFCGATREEKKNADFGQSGRTIGTKSTATGSDEDVLRLYSKIVNQICASHLEDHLEKVLHALVGVHDDYRFNNSRSANQDKGSPDDSESGGRMARPAPAIVWESIVGMPSTVWQQIPFVQVEACVNFLSQHMTTLRWQASMSEGSGKGLHPIGVWQRNGALKSYLDLFTHMTRVVPEQHKWSMISSFFEPMLTTLYQPASTTDGSSISCPWPEEETLTTGTALCSSFVAICADFLKTKPTSQKENAVAEENGRRSSPSPLSTKEKLDLVWGFYLNTLIPHAPVHVCKSFHQFLTRLGWEQWCLTIEIVHHMREVVQTERQQLTSSASWADLREVGTSSPYPFVSWMVRDVLCRMTWKSTEEWISCQAEGVRSVFLSELGKLCVDLVLDLPHFQPNQPRTRNGRGSPAGNSANVLPPYFINFIKQQTALWTKWKITDSELESLLAYAFEAILEPIRDSNGPDDSLAFPSVPSVAVMQDAFTRLQLVLRLTNQATTLNHAAMSKRDCLKRSNLFFRMVFTIFENGVTSITSRGGYSSDDPSAWVTVLFGASCTVLYEKLDEIVQVSRTASELSTTATAAADSNAVTEDELQDTVVEILRLFNLRLVENFFKSEQQGDNASNASSLAWGKCGNVIFVEVDGLIRDFPSSRKISSSRSGASGGRENPWQSDDPVDPNGAIVKPPSVVDSIGAPLGRLLWSFMGFRGGELCCLTACGRAIASVHAMGVVAERSIEKWVIEERRGSWDDLVSRLKIPELSEQEFESACLQQGNLMTLQVLFLQQLRKAPAMSEAFALGMLGKLMTWMEKLHLVSSTTPLMEMKMLFLAAEVTNFVVTTLAEVLPSAHKKQMLRDLCNIMLRFGNARRNHGFMKAIGIGGSLKYTVEFHVCGLAIGVFLRLQTRTGAPLRVDDRIPYKLTRTTEKHLTSLENLLKSKNCFQLQKRMEWIVDFLKSPSRSLADQDEFFVSLFSRIYPSHPWMLAKCITTPVV